MDGEGTSLCGGRVGCSEAGVAVLVSLSSLTPPCPALSWSVSLGVIFLDSSYGVMDMGWDGGGWAGSGCVVDVACLGRWAETPCDVTSDEDQGAGCRCQVISVINIRQQHVKLFPAISRRQGEVEVKVEETPGVCKDLEAWIKICIETRVEDKNKRLAAVAGRAAQQGRYGVH